MSYFVLNNLKINKKTGVISAEVIDMGVKARYRGAPIKYDDLYQEDCEEELTPQQKIAAFMKDLIVGEYYVDDVNSKYFRLNYANRGFSSMEDVDFVDNYGMEYSNMITEERKRQNIKGRLKTSEYYDLIIKLNHKYEKEIDNILNGKTVTGRKLKDYELKEQNDYLKFICKYAVPIIEITEEQEEEEFE